MKRSLITLFVLFHFGIDVWAQNDWREIPINEVPDTIISLIESDFKKYTLNNTSINELESNEILFRVEVQKKNTVYHLVYNADAILKSKTKSKSFTFDGDDMKKKKKSNGGGSNDIMPPRMPSF